ncbi:hypothetical protein BV898_01958 [Hypsibius exemplaris]|uniref:Uncharacterized protein n=1 Tax=Hypsibius exemplaris TaxID=2072580 RepID=A0A1W0X8Y9_HYPEX|nr:hypothetical protein BV898_01958 [Hypsibius exemplaris]
MGKPKWKKSSRGAGPAPMRAPKSSSPSLANIVTVESTLEKIQTYIESCDYALAEKFAVRGLERFPENVEVLEVAAQCFTEVGHIQKARTCYQKAISVSPLKGWRKYLGLAQLFDGRDALLQYTRGIEVMERQIADKATGKNGDSADSASAASSAEPMEAAATTTAGPSVESSGGDPTTIADPKVDADFPSPRDLSSAYLAISELYTTDLCDEENAEEFCKYAIEKAMLADPKNPEPFQQMANLNLIKGDKELAKQFVKGGLSLWYKDGKIGTSVTPKSDAANASVSADAKSVDAVDDEESSGVPPLAFQIETAKALIECEEYDLAGQLFVDFIGQNPTDPELWYLSGLSSFLHGPEHYAEARSDFKKAKRFSTTPHGVCYDIIAQCDEHMSTIATVLPVDEAESDDEDETATPGGSDATNKQANMTDASGEHDGLDWETDEEEGQQQDVEMS